MSGRKFGKLYPNVYLAPDRNNQEAVEKMTQKAQEWHDNIMLWAT